MQTFRWPMYRALGQTRTKHIIPFPYPWMSVRKLSVPTWPSTNWPKPPTSRSPSSRPSYVWSDKSISRPRCTPFGMLYETSPSGIQKNEKKKSRNLLISAINGTNTKRNEKNKIISNLLDSHSSWLQITWKTHFVFK